MIINESKMSGWGEVYLRLVILSLVKKCLCYMLLLFDLLFGLGVRQFMFLRLSSIGDYPVSPLRHILRLGTIV